MNRLEAKAAGKNLIVANGNGPLIISSRDIADACEKQHKHVLRDIEKMVKDIFGDGPNLDHQAISKAYDSRGYVSEYKLPKDLTMTLITGYDAERRYRVIKRLEELEGQANALKADALTSEDKTRIERTEGISRMLANKVTNIEKAIPAIIERVTERIAEQAVAEYMASSNLLVRRGQTAETIWLRHGLPKGMRGATNWFGNRLSEMGCAAGRADRANGQIRLFDPDKADICMKNGLLHKSKVYASERMGQSKFKLIGGKP